MGTSLPLIGEDFAGYRLRAVLGRGGMSVVYEAENVRLGSVVALKVLAPELATQDVFRARFLQESRVAASLNHPNVIPIYDTGPCGDLLYIAMRYVSGADLRAVLKTYGHISPAQTLLLVSQAGRALDSAHRHGLVHRDVKPANILIERDEEDEPDHVYLADFGITKHALSKSGLTATGQFVGTIDYIAPEQIQDKPVDARTDIYSLGCVIYECLTGRVPFKKEVDAAVLWAHVEERPSPPSSLQPDLPQALDDVILRALAKDPADRYATCRNFIGAAREAMETSREHDTTVMAGPPSVLAASPTAPPRPREPHRRAEREPEPAGAASDAGGAFRSVGAAHGQARSRSGERRRWRWLAAAGVVAAALVGGAAALALSNGSSGPSHARASRSAVSDKPPAKPMPPPNRIMRALAVTNQSAEAKGLIPPATCKPASATLVTCSRPSFGADTVRFRTYPSLSQLYTAYADTVKSMSNGQYRTNFNDCNPSQTNGEVAWNHAHHHPKIYSVDQMMMGRTDDNQAAGRVFCTFSNDELHMVWTQSDGRLLAQLAGAPHVNTWNWWYKVHHNIDLGGSMQMSGSGSAMQSTTSTGKQSTTETGMQMSTTQ